jgi:hypothetical protein
LSSQIYLFAHQALPVQTFADPSRMLSILAGPEGQRFLDDAWQIAGRHCDPDKRVQDASPSYTFSPTGTSGVVAVVKPPEPQEPGEAHFIAILGRFEQAENPDLAKLRWVRLFTLERAIHPVNETECTMLCEWTAEGAHKNYGDGPPADEELFVEAVLDLLWKNSEQAEREMGDQARAMAQSADEPEPSKD